MLEQGPQLRWLESQAGSMSKGGGLSRGQSGALEAVTHLRVCTHCIQLSPFRACGMASVARYSEFSNQARKLKLYVKLCESHVFKSRGSCREQETDLKQSQQQSGCSYWKLKGCWQHGAQEESIHCRGPVAGKEPLKTCNHQLEIIQQR